MNSTPFLGLVVLNSAGLRDTAGVLHKPGTPLSQVEMQAGNIIAWVRSGQVGSAHTFEDFGPHNLTELIAKLYAGAEAANLAFQTGSPLWSNCKSSGRAWRMNSPASQRGILTPINSMKKQ